jgi:nitrogen regulatory protein P-II 1
MTSKEERTDYMKYIIAVIQPDRLDEVLKRLTDEEVHLVTVSNVVGRGRQKGVAQVYRSHKEQGSLLKKVKLEIAHRSDRRRQDLHSGTARVHPYPHRRTR